MKSISILFFIFALSTISCNSAAPTEVDQEKKSSTANKNENDVAPQLFNIEYINEHITIGKAKVANMVGLSEDFNFFKTSFLIDVKEKLKPIPAAIDHGNDWAGNREQISVLRTKRKSIKIEINQKKGWTDRSKIRFFNPIIIDHEGRFISDVFIDALKHKGSRPSCWFIEENGEPNLIIELKDAKTNKTSYVKTELDPIALTFTKVSPTKIKEIDKGKPIKEMLSERAWDTFVEETGASKKNLQQKKDGSFIFGDIFYPILDKNTPAVKIGDLIFVNYN